MSTTPRGWTVEELIAWEEREGKITPHFSADERNLAHAAAAAWYFWSNLTELPARAPRESSAFGAMVIGIHRVQERREGRW
jgi:hypothetical protein